MSSFLVKSVVSFQKHGSSWEETSLHGENDIPGDVFHRHVDETLKNGKSLIIPVERLYPKADSKQYYSLICPLENKRASIAIMVFLHDLVPEDFLKQITPLIGSMCFLNNVVLPEANKKTDTQSIGVANKPAGKMGSLEKSLRLWISSYKAEQDGKLYDFLISEVDKVLLPLVMEKFDSNKSKAAKILGINRNTLRKKMTELDIL